MTATVAALYVDLTHGPYPRMPGVECWGQLARGGSSQLNAFLTERDAREYAGPHPVVAHPPCGPWGKMAHFCKYQDRTLAPAAVEQVLRWGGVLEHPSESRLFGELDLPRPGKAAQIRNGRRVWSMYVEQVRWGHVCRKPTALLLVDVPEDAIGELPPEREPVAAITNSGRWTGKHQAERPFMSKRRRATEAEARATPPAFAEWLVSLARSTILH